MEDYSQTKTPFSFFRPYRYKLIKCFSTSCLGSNLYFCNQTFFSSQSGTSCSSVSCFTLVALILPVVPFVNVGVFISPVGDLIVCWCVSLAPLLFSFWPPHVLPDRLQQWFPWVLPALGLVSLSDLLTSCLLWLFWPVCDPRVPADVWIALLWSDCCALLLS